MYASYIFVLLANLLLLLRLCGKVPSMLLLALRATKTSRGQGFDFLDCHTVAVLLLAFGCREMSRHASLKVKFLDS